MWITSSMHVKETIDGATYYTGVVVHNLLGIYDVILNCLITIICDYIITLHSLLKFTFKLECLHWINSMGVTPETVNNLGEDLNNGVILLKVMHVI